MTPADERSSSATAEVIARRAITRTDPDYIQSALDSHRWTAYSDTSFESLHGLTDRRNVRATVTKDEAAAGGRVQIAGGQGPG
jgi:hypothetical protein